MSDLSYMEKMLDGVEVEWKELGEVCRFINGKAYKKPELLERGKYPVLRVGNFFTNDSWYYSDLELHEDKYCDDGDLLYAWSASFGPRIWEGGKVIYHYHIWKVIPKTEIISKKYLFYLLDWDTEELKAEHGTGSTMMHVGKGAIEKRLVPVPPLNVQAKVVKILDALTERNEELEAELKAELEARKQQYTYYREKLLVFKESEVKWSTLGEVAEYSKTRISYELLNEKNYVGVNNLLQNKAGKEESSHVPIQGNSTKYQDNDILIGNIRPYLKKIWQADCVGGTNGDVLVVHPNDESVHPRYLYQILADDNFFNYNMQHAKGAKMPRGDKSRIMEYKIPIPSLPEQQRIVAILDKFDALTTSLTEGLPREIELRQQQYEYYRELLLSFPKAEVADHD